MCFNKEMTLVFTIASVLIGGWVLTGTTIWKNTASWRLKRISICFFYFAIMEGLQYVNYLVIDDCANATNIFSTALGWIHICFQPLFSNFAMSAIDSRNLNQERDYTWKFIFKLTFTIGILMSLRYFILLIGGDGIIDGEFLRQCVGEQEGVCGPQTCSTTGIYHIKWTFKMLKPTYAFPNVAGHFIGMFVCPLLMGNIFQAIVLFCTGPLIAVSFRVSDGEKSSIWCFFSIAETAITIGSQLLIIYLSRKKENKKSKTN